MRKTQLFKSIGKVAGVIALGLLSATGAKAATIIDFGSNSSGGTVTVTGGNLAGANIPVDVFQVIGAPQNNGVYDTTGAAVNGEPGDDGTSAALSFNTDPLNNFIKIIGGIPAFGIANGTTLLSGTITAFQIIQNQALIILSNAIGIDTKDASLLRHIGLAANTPFELFGFSIAFTTQPGGTTGVPFSTDISNTATPEPGSLLLLGSGLVGVVLAARRKRAS